MTSNNIDSITETYRDKVCKAVREILHQNSGGMKMSALLVKLISKFNDDPDMDIFTCIRDDEIDLILENAPDIRIYEYDWDMECGNGTGTIRSKQFVCTKY